jgi:hypothetical protein
MPMAPMGRIRLQFILPELHLDIPIHSGLWLGPAVALLLRTRGGAPAVTSPPLKRMVSPNQDHYGVLLPK